MTTKEIDNKDQDFWAAKGLVRFADRKVLYYVRDNKTKSYPNAVDLIGGAREGSESPFETFAREVKEEMALDITRDQISFAVAYVSSNETHEQPRLFYFMVAEVPTVYEKAAKLGNEGSMLKIENLNTLLSEPTFIPYLKQQVEKYKSYCLGTSLDI